MGIFLETKRLTLKTTELSDLDNLVALRSDPDVMRYIGDGAVHTEEQVKRFLSIALPYQKKHGIGFCMVFEKKSGAFVGQAGLFHIGYYDAQPEIEIAYRLHKKFWGKGYATELAKALIQRGFQNLSVNKLIAATEPENISSQKVLKKAGLDYTGKIKWYDGRELFGYAIYKNDSVELVSYDAQWPKMAELEIKKLREILPGNYIIDIQHVGSTAIPGMLAKPIIDIQIAVDSLAAIKQAAIDILKNHEYAYWDEDPDPEKMFFVKGMPPFGEKRTHHVHIIEPKSKRWQTRIIFRDYLIAHPEMAREYEKLKIKLAREYTYDREQYTDAKTKFIDDVLCKARVTTHTAKQHKVIEMHKYLFKTNRLGFQLLKKEDIVYLEKLDSDPEVRRFFPSGAHTNRQATESMISKFISNHKESGLPCFIVFELDSKEFIGRCDLSFLDTGEVEINYIFHKKYWGQGYASEAVSELLTWARNNVDVDYIIAYAPLTHYASLRVMEKCGMEYYKNDIDSIDNVECRFYRIKNKVTVSKFVIELKNQEITGLGVEAIIDFYRTMAIDQFQLPGLNAFLTGADSPSLNVVLDIRKNGQFNADTVNPLTDFFNNHQVPWGWFITAIAVPNDIEKHGFNLLYETHGMYFDLTNALPKIDIINATIKEAYDDLQKWIEPLLEGFPSESGENDDVYRKLNAALLSKGEKKLRHFTAYIENESACSGTLFLTENAVMLHNLATKNKFKKLGLGTALTVYMMSEAKKLGYKHCFLDSSDEGFNLYRKLGFKVYCVTSVYGIDKV